MLQHPLKGTALRQEMADVANPAKAEEDRAKRVMDRLPHVQAASRRLQGQLDIHGDETWPLPPLPYDRNPFILETNAAKIRAALEDCKHFAVTTDRESAKIEFLDAVAKHHEKQVVMGAGQAPKIRLTSFEDEKKAREAEASNAIARMMEEGLLEALKELEDEGMSGKAGKISHPDIADHTTEVPSTPKSLFHSVATPANTAPETSEESIIAASEDEQLSGASQGGSSVDTTERERREYWEELRRDPHFLSIGPAGPEDDSSTSPDTDDRSNTTESTLGWIYRENATPDPHYDREGNEITYNTPTASNEDQEMRTPTHEPETETETETETASSASQHIPTALAPPSRELRALSVHNSEVGVTQSMIDETTGVLNAHDNGKGREPSSGIGETMSDGPKAKNEGKGEELSSNFGDDSPYASQGQQEGEGKQAIPIGRWQRDDGKERHGKRREELDVAATLRYHSITLVQSKAKERSPPVPQPESMPSTLTEAICSYMPLEAKPILTLTLERVDPPVPSPTDQRCILLKHFEVGLDGVEGLCQGTAKIPETPEVTAEREQRVGKLGTFKQGDGGFYRSLKRAQQKEQKYGMGYWYFFGVKFKQTGKEKKLRRGGKWFLFGAPIEAVYHLDIKRSQENVTVMLGGGVNKSGTVIDPFEANFKRTHTLFSRGGLAPMDIWPGGEEWEDGVFGDMRAAMANNGLRVGFLYADTQTFTPRPKSFPAAGKNQAEKKRKQSGPDMTEEEIKAMEKSMRPKKLSAEDIGAILAARIFSDRARGDAEALSK